MAVDGFCENVPYGPCFSHSFLAKICCSPAMMATTHSRIQGRPADRV